jgi:hypothetical protein
MLFHDWPPLSYFKSFYFGLVWLNVSIFVCLLRLMMDLKKFYIHHLSSAVFICIHKGYFN